MQVTGFQTQRLTVQNWSSDLDDPAKRAALVSALTPILTPAVLLHLPEPLQLADAPHAVSDWITDRAEESDVMTIRDMSDNTMLGLLILAVFPEPDAPSTVHLGYLLGERAWGKGYATELLEGLISWVQDQATPVMLLGGVERDNPASAKVLLKNGFSILPELATETSDMYRRVIAP